MSETRYRILMQGVVRVCRRTGISVDRLAMHPFDEVAGRERPHARGVPDEVGVVEEAAPVGGAQVSTPAAI